MYTRQEFERQRDTVKNLARREGRILAALSVGLGVALLVIIRWSDFHFEPGQAKVLSVVLFLAYMALLGWMYWRMERKIRISRPACPQCGALLKDMSERIAVATGKCDSCGGQVIG